MTIQLKNVVISNDDTTYKRCNLQWRYNLQTVKSPMTIQLTNVVISMTIQLTNVVISNDDTTYKRWNLQLRYNL